MKKAVIFDMDGVLIDSEPVYLNRFEIFFDHHHIPVNKNDLKKTVGASSKATWDIIRKLWPEDISVSRLREMFYSLSDRFSISYKDILFPNVIKTLQLLKKQNYRIALASSSSFSVIHAALSATDTSDYFDAIVSGEMFKESKPNPEIYLYTICQLSLPPHECIVVEDSVYGIAAAKAAHLDVAAIRDTRFGFNQSNATYLIDDVAEILDILKSLNGSLKIS
jgi:HAD superfamily hydrolase (TIGR01509 family)